MIKFYVAFVSAAFCLAAHAEICPDRSAHPFPPTEGWQCFQGSCPLADFHYIKVQYIDSHTLTLGTCYYTPIAMERSNDYIMAKRLSLNDLQRAYIKSSPLWFEAVKGEWVCKGSRQDCEIKEL